MAVQRLADGMIVLHTVEGQLPCILEGKMFWVRAIDAILDVVLLSDISEKEDFAMCLHWKGVHQKMPQFQMRRLSEIQIQPAIG